ncbi:hypothetical protein GCM10027159_35070 [Lysobacter terrae]
MADGSYGSLGESPSWDAVQRSFDVNFDQYNEWLLQGADVTGIFVANPNLIQAKKCQVLQAEGLAPIYEIFPAIIDLAEIFAEFPAMPVYTMSDRGVVRIR